jgi:hypothetical protein
MPRRIRNPRYQRRALTSLQRNELVLGIEAGAFASELARRRAWFAWRDDLLRRVNLGRRPWAFWLYEVGGFPHKAIREVWVNRPLTDIWEMRPVDETQTEALDRLGLLGDEERARLVLWGCLAEAVA